MASGRKENLELNLIATDKASDKIDDVAKAVDRLEGRDAKVDLGADDNATTTIEDVEDKVDTLDSAKAEVTIEAKDETKNTLDDIDERMEKLTDDEKVAVLKAKGADAQREIDRINTLLASDIDGETATALLAAKDNASQTIADVRGKIDSIQGAQDDLIHGRPGEDQSRSVMANWAGNMAQELPGLQGALGPVSMAIGQFAEYAAEGNISMKNLIKTGGAMAGVTAAFVLATGIIKTFQDSSKQAERTQKELEDALEESGNEALALARHLETDGEALGEWGRTFVDGSDRVLDVLDRVAGNLPLFGNIFGDDTEEKADAIVDAMSDAGLTIHQVTRAALEGGDAWEEFSLQIARAHNEGRITTQQYDDLTNFVDAYSEAQAEANEHTDVFALDLRAANDALADVIAQEDPLSVMSDTWNSLIEDAKDGVFNFENAATAIEQLAEATGMTTDEVIRLINQEANEALEEDADAARDAAEAAEEHAEALRDQEIKAIEDQIDALQEAVDILDEYNDATRENADLAIQVEGALEDVEAAQTAYNEAVASGDPAAQEEAAEELRDAIIDLVDAQVEQAAQQAVMNGASLTRVQRIDAENAAYLEQARNLEGPAREALLRHVLRLNDIPEEVITEILAGTDAEDLRRAEEALGNGPKGVSRTRQAAIEADAKEGALKTARSQLDVLSNQRTAPVIADARALGARRILDDTARTRNAPVVAQGYTYAANRDINEAAKTRYSSIVVSASTWSALQAIYAVQSALRVAASLANIGIFAKGSSYTPEGMALVGEQGPELIQLPRGSKVMTAGQTRAIQSDAPAETSTINNNFVFNMPRGTRAADVAAAVRRQTRIQGPI
jgi:hypothetical protein